MRGGMSGKPRLAKLQAALERERGMAGKEATQAMVS